MDSVALDVRKVRVSDAVEWFSVMGEKGEYSPATARNCVQAVKRLCSVLTEDEDANPQLVDLDLDHLAERYARINPGNNKTLRTYKSRAELLIREFLRFLEDPTNFKPQLTRAPRRTSGTQPKKRKKAKVAIPADGVPRPKHRDMREYPLDDHRTFEFILPDEGITMDDLRRVTFHLATLAVDFDPILGLRPVLEGKS